MSPANKNICLLFKYSPSHTLNSKNPKSKECEKLRQTLEKKYEVTVVSISVAEAEEDDFKEITKII